MGQLEINLKLGLEAVKYAKQQVKRSGNQTYFKPWKSGQNQKRNEFILGATRGGSYIKYTDGTYEKDTELAKRRKELQQLVHSNVSEKVKEAKIDKMRKDWGEDYFWDGDSNPAQLTIDKVAKVMGLTNKEVQEMIDQSSTQQVLNLYHTAKSAKEAAKFGVGNCQEKAEVACMYLMDRTPGGIHLALYALEREYGGITGKPGDHVFGVFGLTTVSDNIATLGKDAIIIDGWMNDAYPAQKFLDFKYGWNYNNERINLKQFGVRNMVCVSYRNHIECKRDFGVVAKGPGTLPTPNVRKV